jgi:hypothetical protein
MGLYISSAFKIRYFIAKRNKVAVSQMDGRPTTRKPCTWSNLDLIAFPAIYTEEKTVSFWTVFVITMMNIGIL